MFALLIVLGLLVNGDFSQGLAHWNADSGWSVQNKVAQLEMDNRAGDFTRGANLCSEPAALNAERAVRGAAGYSQIRTFSGADTATTAQGERAIDI